MMRALWTAASGMGAQQLQMDVISNNLANVNTNGFKKSRVDFQDLLYEHLRHAGSVDSAGQQLPLGLEVGHGVRPADTQKIFTTGNATVTNNPLDLMINGDGFFQVTLPNGQIQYTRDGSFKTDANGRVVTADGYPMEPAVTIPSTATGIVVLTNGQVQITLPNGQPNQVVGQIELARVANPAGMESEGQNLFSTTDASGEVQVGTPGVDAIGSIQQGALEGSNVATVDEMVNLITTQRAYESNTKVVTASDLMMQQANTMHSTGV
jgi:flagellar basal-body rod protein FlgG